MRMIVVFEKGFMLRHIGHLDLMRTIQRALRRTNLPIRYSNGFNPHIQLSFAAPLSVGVVGLHEIMDVPILGEYDTQAFTEELNLALPACLKAYSSRAVPDDFPALMSLVAGSRIRIEIEGGEAADKIFQAFEDFMKTEECVTLRKTKSGENMTNIRPFVEEADMVKSPDGYTLKCLMANLHEGSLKPAVLMNALCELAQMHAVPYIAYRDAIFTKGRDGQYRLLEAYGND